jgi:hypothetical protein
MALPCFNEYHQLFFYPSGNKIVPSNISDLLTSRALVF